MKRHGHSGMDQASTSMNEARLGGGSCDKIFETYVRRLLMTYTKHVDTELTCWIMEVLITSLGSSTMF